MTDKECPNCGVQYKLSLKDKLLRKQVTLVSMQFPALNAVAAQAQDYCNDCWRLKVKPMAMAVAGVEEKHE